MDIKYISRSVIICIMYIYIQLTDRKIDNSCQNVDAMKMPLHVEVKNLYTHLNER